MTKHTLAIERHHLGELSQSERAALAAQVDLGAEVARLEADNNRILAAYPPDAVVAEVLRRAQRLDARDAQRRRQRRTRWRLALAAPLAIAAAVALTVRPAVPPTPLAPVTDGARAKALHPELHVYLRAASGSVRLEDGALSTAGDVLQLAYSALGTPYGVVVSIDGGGGVTLHHPATEDAPTNLDPSGEIPMPYAYALDDAPTFERFFVVGADHPIDVASVLAAAQLLAVAPNADTAPLPLPDDLTQTPFLLEKP